MSFDSDSLLCLLPFWFCPNMSMLSFLSSFLGPRTNFKVWSGYSGSCSAKITIYLMVSLRGRYSLTKKNDILVSPELLHKMPLPKLCSRSSLESVFLGRSVLGPVNMPGRSPLKIMHLAALLCQRWGISAYIQKMMFRYLWKFTEEKRGWRKYFSDIPKVLQQGLKIYVMNVGTQSGVQTLKSMWNQALDGTTANWHVLTYAFPDVSWQLWDPSHG